MKKILLLALLLPFFGIGNVWAQKTETFSVANFSGINASSAFNITVNKSSTESLKIEADEEIMPYVRAEVKNGELKLYVDDRKAVKNIKVLKATVGVRNLNKVKLSGACKLNSNDLFETDKFEVDLSGACNVQLKVKARKLETDASGACRLDMTVEAREAEFDLSGSSSAQLTLNIAEKVSVDMSGACKATMQGSAVKAEFELSGVGNIKAADLVCKNVEVEASGASTVEVHATDTLSVDSSGATNVRYKGHPTLKLDNSGASKVKSME